MDIIFKNYFVRKCKCRKSSIDMAMQEFRGKTMLSDRDLGRAGYRERTGELGFGRQIVSSLLKWR